MEVSKMEKGLKVLIGVLIVLVVVFGVTLAVWPGEQPVKSTAKATTKVAKQPTEIKLGVIMPLTGDAATLGQNIVKSIQMAVEEVNAEGGIDGRKIRVIAEDGKCDGKEASTAANKLANIDKVDVVIGGGCSSETMAAAPIFEAAKIVAVSPVSSASTVTKAGEYIFRTCASDALQGGFVARYADSELNAKKAAVLYVQSDWGVDIRGVFKREFLALGGQIVADEAFEQESRDLRTQLTKIKAADPDVIYFIGYTEASIVGIKQAKELGITAKIIGGDAWDDPKIWSEVGSAGDGVMYTLQLAEASDEFKQKLKAFTGSEEVTLGVPQAYDTVHVLADVMRQVGTDSDAIRAALYDVDYDGVSSRIQFDENGDLKDTSFIVKVANNGKTSVLQ
jgi:branched-chain amino acid transport system substrate-binding protein